MSVYPSEQIWQDGLLAVRIAELEGQVLYWKQMFLDLKAKYEPDTSKKTEAKVSLYDDQGRKVISQARAADKIGVGRGTIHKWVENGKLPAVKIEGRNAKYVLEATCIRPPYERRMKKSFSA